MWRLHLCRAVENERARPSAGATAAGKVVCRDAESYWGKHVVKPFRCDEGMVADDTNSFQLAGNENVSRGRAAVRDHDQRQKRQLKRHGREEKESVEEEAAVMSVS